MNKKQDTHQRSFTQKIVINSFLLSSIISFQLSANIYHDTVGQIKKIYNRVSRHAHLDFLNLDIVKSDTKFKEFLQQIAENDQGILSEISAYYHPAGFIKIVLYKGSKGEQLRFHFWGKGGPKAIQQDFNNGWEPIHNHRWNFSSKIITGGLDMKEYHDADARMRFDNKDDAEDELMNLNKTYKLYDVFIIPSRKKEEDYTIIQTGKFAVIGNYTRKYMRPGHSYYLDHRIPHKVKPDLDTSTILLMDPASKITASEIFPNVDDHFEEEFKLQYLNPDETQKYLKEFLQSLQF